MPTASLQKSGPVPSLPSLHGVSSAGGTPIQAPPSQRSLSVQELPSSQAAPSRAVGFPRQEPLRHASFAVHALPSSQAVPSAWAPSSRHAALEPVQLSAASHGLAAGRATP